MKSPGECLRCKLTATRFTGRTRLCEGHFREWVQARCLERLGGRGYDQRCTFAAGPTGYCAVHAKRRARLEI